MMDIWFNPSRELDLVLRAAAERDDAFDATFDPGIRPAEPRFGDFQANGILPYAKKNRQNPRELATKLIAALETSQALDTSLITWEIAGPGFINFRFTPKFFLCWLELYRDDASLQSAAGAIYQGKHIIIDYPSPNTAKQMHVGHLRPMVIGEAIQRLLRFCGAKMTRDNHIGDWGTNFGTLIMAIKRSGFDLNNPGDQPLEEIERLYKEGSSLEKEDPSLRDISRSELVKLQNGDEENVRLWNRINEISKDAFDEMYSRLGLEFEETLGESFYRDKVERVYEELIKHGIAEESEGALVVFHDDHPRFSRNAKRPQPFIIRKKDGASNYASTDLATILYRYEHFKAEEIVYVTDGRQQDHFEQLFLTAEKWFVATGRTLPKLHHVWFGTILGPDGKAIKTKSGEPIRLKGLLDEAEERSFAIVNEKNADLNEAERREIARVVGLGAVRYADLSQNRTGDYVFAWDKLLSLEGNTAPYLLYAIARIHSIFRKVGIEPGEGEAGASDFTTEEEIALAQKLLAFVATINLTISDLRPHQLCTYLYELAGTFSSFYNANKVIMEEKEVQARRLMLCARTLRVMETGLNLLGLETLKRM